MSRWLVDTNVLLRLNEAEKECYVLTENALERLGLEGNTLCTTPQVLVEFWCTATRPVSVNGMGWDTALTHKKVKAIQDQFALLPDNADIVSSWLSLVSSYDIKGKQVHDARLVAVMLTHGVSNILTYNFADFKGYTEITAVSPADIVQQAK